VRRSKEVEIEKERKKYMKIGRQLSLLARVSVVGYIRNILYMADRM
jgi:hypothetical protein